MEKVSDKLFALVESYTPEKEVNLNIMRRKGIASESLAALVNELADLSVDKDSIEILPASGIVMMKGTLRAIENIVKHPEIEWVDRIMKLLSENCSTVD